MIPTIALSTAGAVNSQNKPPRAGLPLSYYSPFDTGIPSYLFNNSEHIENYEEKMIYSVI